MAAALPLLGRKLRGFDSGDAVLTGPGDPFILSRAHTGDKGCCSSVRGLYPAARGAGWAEASPAPPWTGCAAQRRSYRPRRREMKRLWLIGGPMGVGKSRAGHLLRDRLPRSVYLDGDWCWDARPFVVTEETKAMVLQNIRFLLENFLRCSEYENVVPTWVMHRQEILDELTRKLPDCETIAVSLLCAEAELRRRLERYRRRAPGTGRARARRGALPLYAGLRSFKLDTTCQSREDRRGD